MTVENVCSFHKSDNPVLRTYSIGDQTIQSVDSICDLGVVFQSDFLTSTLIALLLKV